MTDDIQCSKCRRWLKPIEFYLDGKRPRSRCKPCIKQESASYYNANAKRVNERRRARRSELIIYHSRRYS